MRFPVPWPGCRPPGSDARPWVFSSRAAAWSRSAASRITWSMASIASEPERGFARQLFEKHLAVLRVDDCGAALRGHRPLLASIASLAQPGQGAGDRFVGEGVVPVLDGVGVVDTELETPHGVIEAADE